MHRIASPSGRLPRALVARVLGEVEGHPFFIRLWGAGLWEAAQDAGLQRFTEPLLDSIEDDVYRRLDEGFDAGRVEALTPSEQDLLVSTASCPYPPLRTSDIRSRTDKCEGNVNVLMGRLNDQGVLCRVQNGTYEYTAPEFHRYLQRRVAAAQVSCTGGRAVRPGTGARAASGEQRGRRGTGRRRPDRHRARPSTAAGGGAPAGGRAAR